MAFTKVSMIHHSGGVDKDYVTTYTERWQAVSNQRFESPPDIITASDGVRTVPAMYTAPAYDAKARVIGKTFDMANEREGVAYVVTVNYSTNYKEVFEDPLLEPADWNVAFQDYTEDTPEDVNGKPYKNSAGTPFLHARPMSLMRISVRKNIVYYNAQFAQQYHNSINDQQYLGFPKNTIRIANIGGHWPLTKNGITYAELAVDFEVRVKTWNPKIYDKGKYDKRNNKPSVLPDADGMPVNGENFLDGSGNFLSLLSPPVKLSFQDYREMNFSNLGL